MPALPPTTDRDSRRYLVAASFRRYCDRSAVGQKIKKLFQLTFLRLSVKLGVLATIAEVPLHESGGVLLDWLSEFADNLHARL